MDVELEKMMVTGDAIKQGEGFADFLCQQVYSAEDKARWAKTIKDFNALYYFLNKQTWSITMWRGIHVLKPPTDLWIYQELIHEIAPDLIVETGTYCGGSALYMRDILNLVNPSGLVLSIDIDHDHLRPEARQEGIEFYQGSSVEVETVKYIKDCIEKRGCQKVMVVLDSDHEEAHVLKEMELYGPLVTKGSVFIVEDGNNHAGVKAALEQFAIDPLLNGGRFKKTLMGEKFMLTFNRDGYWEKVA